MGNPRFLQNVSNGQFSKQKYSNTTGLSGAMAQRKHDKISKNHVQTDEMNHLADKACLDKKGCSIGCVKGQKVVCMSGSCNVTDWAFDALDALPCRWHVASDRTAKSSTETAKDNKADVVAGHLRGGMLVSKMDIPDHKKLSVDGAVRLAAKKERES